MPKKIAIGVYDKKHKANLAKRAAKVKQLYEEAIKRIAKAAASAISDADAAAEFSFDDFPALRKETEALMRDLCSSLQANIEDGDEESWQLSNTKNDALVNSVVGKAKLPTDMVSQWTHPHLEALSSFIGRKEAGMNLSKRVWNLTEQLKAELELALELGMGQGKSAAELSRDVRRYLKQPDKLFRRVRDKSGALRLSKSAAAYHPGRGVYRSSYKNALRMTATENNIAYRTADHNRWQNLPFVLGIETRISNNHPKTDICDTFDGVQFPKDFKFTGWHPWCRCYAVSVLASQEEMDAYTRAIINGDDVSNWKFKGQIDTMPEEFNQWVKDNRERIANAKTQPYFIRDNQKAVEEILKGKGKILKKKEKSKPKTPLTPEQRARRNEIKAEAKKLLHGMEMHNDCFDKPITISNTAIKEWLNQPFSEIMAKNEALLTLPKLIKDAEYLGYGADKHDPNIIAHFFQTQIGGANAWIIVREMDEKCSVYSISDNVSIIGHIIKRRG